MVCDARGFFREVACNSISDAWLTGALAEGGGKWAEIFAKSWPCAYKKKGQVKAYWELTRVVPTVAMDAHTHTHTERNMLTVWEEHTRISHMHRSQWWHGKRRAAEEIGRWEICIRWLSCDEKHIAFGRCTGCSTEVPAGYKRILFYQRQSYTLDKYILTPTQYTD